jgi:predicted transposase YdaD
MTELGKSLWNDGRKEEKREIAKNLLDILSIEVIAQKTGLSIEEVEEIKDEVKNDRTR